MTYKVSGTEFALQPTAGRWLPRKRISYSGTGHSVYAGVREFEIRWELVAESDLNQITGFFDSVGTTGTVVVSLPEFASLAYQFFDYTGCVLHEPEINRYFAEHTKEVILLVTNIRT